MPMMSQGGMRTCAYDVEANGVHMSQVCQAGELDQWHLYLVDWGYNTEQERNTAGQNERIAVVNISQLQYACGQHV